jgi:hypothetical protein
VPRRKVIDEPARRELCIELAAAWRSLGDAGVAPRPVRVLTRRGDRAKVCRLVGCAPRGGDVVAKRTTATCVEWILYEGILPAISSRAPRCYGIADDGAAGGPWLFLEHVGWQPDVPAGGEHHALTLRWLAAVHSATSGLKLSRELPDRGPAHYRAACGPHSERSRMDSTRPRSKPRVEPC